MAILLASFAAWLLVEMLLIVLACRRPEPCPCCDPLADPVTMTVSPWKDPGDECEFDVQFICIIKGRERYIFLFADTPTRRRDVIDTAERFAANEELSFTEMDAEVVAMQLARLEWAEES